MVKSWPFNVGEERIFTEKPPPTNTTRFENLNHHEMGLWKKKNDFTRPRGVCGELRSAHAERKRNAHAKRKIKLSKRKIKHIEHE